MYKLYEELICDVVSIQAKGIYKTLVEIGFVLSDAYSASEYTIKYLGANELSLASVLFSLG